MTEPVIADLFADHVTPQGTHEEQSNHHITLKGHPFNGVEVVFNKEKPIDDLQIDEEALDKTINELIAKFETQILNGKLKRNSNGTHETKITFKKDPETGLVFATSDQGISHFVDFQTPEIIREASGHVDTTIYVQSLLPDLLSPQAFLRHEWDIRDPIFEYRNNKIAPFRMKPGYYKTEQSTIAPTAYNEHGVTQAVIPFLQSNGWGAMTLANFKKPIPFTLFNRLSGTDKKVVASLNSNTRATFLWSMTHDLNVFPVLMWDRRTKQRKAQGKLHSQWDGFYKYIEPANVTDEIKETFIRAIQQANREIAGIQDYEHYMELKKKGKLPLSYNARGVIQTLDSSGKNVARTAACITVTKQAHWKKIIETLMQLEPHGLAFSGPEYTELVSKARQYYELQQEEPDAPEYAQLNFLTESGRIKRSIYTEPKTPKAKKAEEPIDPGLAIMG